MEIRKPVYAGMFYPGSADELREMIDEFLDAVPLRELDGNLKCLIVPHAGYVYSGPVAASGFSLLKNLDQKREWKVVILGPSHHEFFNGAAVSTDSEWETPLGRVACGDLRSECAGALLIDAPSAHAEEHSLEVEVPFLQVVLKKFKIYPLCLGNVNPEQLAENLGNFCARDDVLLVVSSDLSHYHPYEEANKIDEAANKAVPALDFNADFEACGKTGILTAINIARDLKWKGHFLDYGNSGDTAGGKFHVVGYGAYAFTAGRKKSPN